MSNGIRSLPRYQAGGATSSDPVAGISPPRMTMREMEEEWAKRQKIWRLMAERRDPKKENRRRAMAGERGYATIGPRPPWAERVAAQVRSVPRRINRALQPETAGETAALVGASMVEPLGTGIDIADIIAGARTLDFPRIGWGAAGLATPWVAGSAMRRMTRGARGRVPSKVYSDHSEAFKGATQDQAHADALETIMKRNNIDPSSLTDQDWEDLQFGKLIEAWPPEGTGQWLGEIGQKNLAKYVTDNTPSISKDLQRGITALGDLPRRIVRKWEDVRLPMDEASVARRMEEQGYEEFLHGTGRRGEVLSTDTSLDPSRPLFQVDNPDVAEAYGQPRKVYSRTPDQLIFDAEGASWSNIPIEKIRRQIDPSRLEEFDRLAKIPDYQRASPEGHLDTDALSKILHEMGYSGFDAQNLRDAPWSSLQRKVGDVADVPSLVRSTLDPGLVRYEGARFNPRDLGLNLQLAGIAGLLGTGAARRNYVERNRR